MGAASKLADKKFLQELVPLNALSESRFAEVAKKIVVEEVRKGRYLFRKGERDNESIYLLDGKINLIDGHRKVTSEIKAGTDVSRYPIVNQQPRPLTARAVTKVVIARIDSGLLDVFLTWDQSSSTEATEIRADEDEDWMTRILQSEAFIKIPPAIIQRLLMKMETYRVRAGKTVIEQGDEGDYFYTIHQGRCAVTRRETPDGEIIKLAELSDGDSFGEEALVSDARRNATVTMLTDGVLMRLAKKDFVELLKKHLISNVSFETASEMVDAGAVWVDVRSSDEYEAGSFEDSVNIPLSDLRGELPELVFNVKYIICCGTGRRSSSAAFILSHKGFEVYVLDGGLNRLNSDVEEVTATTPEASATGAVITDEGDQPGADIIDFDSRGSEDTDSQIPPPAGAAAELQEEITALRRENAELSQAISTPEDSVPDLADRQAEVERLESALREVRGQLAEVQQTQQSGADESQLIREQYAALQDEHTERVTQLEKQLVESGDMLARLQAESSTAVQERDQLQELAATQQQAEQAVHKQLEAERQSSEQQVDALQTELGAVRKEAAAHLDDSVTTLHEQQQLAEQLRAELEQSRQQVEALENGIIDEKQLADKHADDSVAAYNKVTDGLQQELQQAREQITELETGIAAAHETQRETGAQASAEQRQHEAELDGLRAELHQSQQKIGELEAGIAAARDEEVATAAQAVTDTAQHNSGLDTLRGELELSCQENTTLTDRLASADRDIDELRQQLSELDAGKEAEREELQQQNSALQQEIDAGSLARQELQQQLEALQETHRNDLERLNATTSEHEVVSTRSQEAERQHEALRAENRQLEVERQELQEALENAGAAAQAAEAALEHLQAESARERETLQEDIQERQQQVEELGARMQQLQEQVNEDKAKLEDDLQTRIGKNNEQLEQQELRYLELKQAHSATEEQLLEVTAERDGFRENFDESEQRNTDQGQEIDKLNERITALMEAANEEVRTVGEQLEGEQQRFAELEQQHSEQAAQILSLQKEIGQRDEEQQKLNQQIAGYEKQSGELQQELKEVEERSKTHDLDNQEALNKAYEDLNRKNDNEKEMQAQIERLRKKLEQTTNDLQAARDETRTSAEHFREELQAERRERAEERAELAARQRQLKEQLAAVASEHEDVLSSQEGVLARARDDAREEERSRLEQEPAGRGQAEEQLAALQKDLDRAHAEITEAVQQEQQRNATDLALAREQKSEADTAIVQLETQLKQLTGERDAALEEQQATREQLNTLRAEVEVVRGLMSTDDQGQLEDPAELRAELEESRRNIEIAVRLRTEAEVQRDKALHEMEALRANNGQGGETLTPLEIPSLDDEPPARTAADKPALPVAEVRVTTDIPLPALDVGQADEVTGKTGYGWLGKAIGLGVVAVAALVFWVLLRTESPLIAGIGSGSGDDPVTTIATVETTAPVPDSLPADAAPPAAPAGAAGDPITAAGPGEDTVEVAESAPPERAEPPPVAALRSYRDPLKGGNKGPMMVELPAAGFMMGSSGTSMNFNERPRHRVDLRGFSISKTEVTFAEYDRFARATGRRLPHDEGWGRGAQPVINVSWKDASAYAAWLSKQTGHDYRLPTEAQWEFAARAGGTQPYWWGRSKTEIPANCFDCGSQWDGKRTAAVGSFTANGFGLHDTAGNVQEWVEDCYHANYKGAAADGGARQTPRCTQRVVRGGAYTSPIDVLRSAKRGQYDQDTRLDNLGFRVVRAN